MVHHLNPENKPVILKCFLQYFLVGKQNLAKRIFEDLKNL